MQNEHSSFAHRQERAEHARLVKALRESELLRELAALLASSLDPTHILQVLVRRTTEACDVERCAVWLLHEGQTHLIPSAYHIASQSFDHQTIERAENSWHQSRLPSNHPLFHTLLTEGGLLAVPDLSAVEQLDSFARTFALHSVLLIALIREGRVVGIMSLDNPGRTTSFSHEQKQLAQAIGQQAAVAIDNAHLYQQAQRERKRAERLIDRARSIYQVAMAVNSGEDLMQVLEIAVQHLIRGSEVQSGAIALLKKETLLLACPHTLVAAVPDKQVALNTLPTCQAATRKNAPLFLAREQMTAHEAHWFQQLGMHHVLIAPLLVGSPNASAKKQTMPHAVGFAFVGYPPTHPQPTAGQYAFAQDIATQCALAIEKAEILHQAHATLALANERATTLDAVFNTMTEGILVLDMDGKVILSNATAPLFIGLTRNAKRQLASYLQQYPAYTLQGQPIARDDFPLMRALKGEHIRGERFIKKRSDGSEQPIEVNITPLLDSEARQIGIVSAFRDMTEPVRIERRIRGSLETLLNAVEAVSGVTEIKEILSRVLTMTLTALNSTRGVVQLYAPEERQFIPFVSSGFSADELLPWLAEHQDWLHPGKKHYAGIRTQLMEGHATLMSTEQGMILTAPITYNKRLLGIMTLDLSVGRQGEHETTEAVNPGQTQPFVVPEFSAWDVAVVEGIAQFAGLAIEQTRWQQEATIARTNEASMRESNALKDEFLAITAHEFRTPLTVILAHSQMMARLLRKAVDVSPTLKDRLQESISYIEGQTHQLTNIVNTFLEVTRLNKGQITLAQETLSLDEIAAEAVTNASATSTIHHFSCTVQPGTHPYMLIGDKARLLQIFANLLQNAIKYSPQGGPITVSLVQRRDSNGRLTAEVTVADRGIGVPADAQPRLFERFYRAPNGERSQSRGIGLGLYVVAEFLHLHGGTICVESSGIEGEGSRFIFTLPLLEKGQ